MTFTFWMHGDIVNMQSRLKAALDGTNQSVTACTALDTATASSWASFYSAGVAWTSEAANWINTGSQATQGQAIEQELIAWQEKLSGTCTLTVPIYTGTPANTTASEVIGFGLLGATGLTSVWAFNKLSTHLLTTKTTTAPALGKPKRVRRKSRRHRVARRHHAHA
jgi:hypothetical protein